MCQLPLNDVCRRASALCLLLLILAAGRSVQAQSPPAPDPAGIATGDKTNVTDAAGNTFVVSELTDTSAPDYREKKKAFDEYQATVQREPLAVKLADSVGHLTVAANPSWPLSTGYLVLFMQ